MPSIQLKPFGKYLLTIAHAPVKKLSFLCFGMCISLSASAEDATWDLILSGGTVYDGSGGPPRQLDIGISGDRINALGRLPKAQARQVVDVSGLAVAPGFINVLSWATISLIHDGASQSNIRQGVTLEIFGEGTSMGPINTAMRQRLIDRQGELPFDIPWTTLDEYLEHLTQRGVAPNVASFVGASTVRQHVIGLDQRAPTAAELKRMQALVANAMEDGALGVGSALIYTPGSYASTEELIALASTSAKFGGAYISHLRSEGDRLLEAIDELIEITRVSQGHGEIYHLKVSGQRNWHKFEDAVARIEAARERGLSVAANMYTYTAGSTGFDAGMPTWIQAGGIDRWIERLQDPALRAKAVAEMRSSDTDWENLLGQAGADGTLLVGFKNPDLRHYIGQTLADVAKTRGTSPEETAMDLVVEDGSRVQVVYFLMNEDNVRAKIRLPWMSFGSDAASLAAELPFTRQGTHPRAYGNFARVLGRYTRDEGLLTLESAIHKLTQLNAEKFKLRYRGLLTPGYYADVVVFDPAKITDHATYANPHVYAEGVAHVLVNGEWVLYDGEITSNRPGRVVRGPGWRGWKTENR